MPNLIWGQDPGGAQRPIQVDDNGNLSVDLVSGITVSTSLSSGTLTVDQLSGATWSAAVVNGATTLDVNQVSGSVWSAAVVNGATTLDVKQVSGSADSAVVQGVARQTNPTAVADAAAVTASFDDVGRQVITPYQVRDLVSTAFVALANGTETTLLAAGGAGVYLDLVQIVAANTSDAVVDLTVRSVTAGNTEFILTIPADSTAGFVPSVPYPQGNPNNNWTIDMADVSGTTVNVSALFIKNV